MREFGEQMAQQQGQPGQQGEAMGQADAQGRRDPLGRETGRTAASAPTSSFCRARTSTAGPRSFWTRSAAGRATSPARRRSGITFAASSTSSENAYSDSPAVPAASSPSIQARKPFAIST